MRIGIDATAIPVNRGGAGNYIFYLVKSLAEIDKENEYFIFAKQKDIDEWRIHQPNFRLLLSGSTSQPIRLVWEQTILPQLIKKHRIDVLHSPHYTMPLMSNCRIVVTFHDVIFFLYPKLYVPSKVFFFQLIMRLTSRRADKIITVSRNTARDVVNLLHINPDIVYPALLGVSDQFKPISDTKIIAQVCHKYNLSVKQYILYVGFLEPRKNVPDLVKAYYELVRQGYDHQLVIVGKKGWMFDEIFELVVSLNLQERVVFLGYIPEEDLVMLYNGASVFVYPSRYEGFGIPILEAMQCGTPVVTSNISSMPEVAGDAALLVTPNDVNGLSTAIGRVLQDEAFAKNLSQQGLERACQFSWQRCAQETLAVYQSFKEL